MLHVANLIGVANNPAKTPVIFRYGAALGNSRNLRSAGYFRLILPFPIPSAPLEEARNGVSSCEEYKRSGFGHDLRLGS